jgi:LysM domain
VVQSGDSLWSLARKHDVSVVALQEANHMGANERIRAGQTLRLPPVPTSRDDKPATVKQAPTSASVTSSPTPASGTARPASAASPSGTATPLAAPLKSTSPSSSASVPPVDRVQAASTPSSARPISTTGAGSLRAEPVSAVSVSAGSSSAAPARSTAATVLKAPSAEARRAAETLYSRGAPVTATNTLAENIPAWVLAEPPPSTQGEKPASVRGGIFPCAAPDPGFAHYAKWVQVAPMAHVLAPPASPSLSSVRSDGSFDVVFHFHGREPIRKEWVRAMEGTRADAVLVAVDIGIASEPYRETFRDPRTFSEVLRAVEAELQRRSGNPRAFAQNITLSAWSAGYGAVEQLLGQPIPQSRVGSVVLLDGLHAGFQGSSLNAERMEPFVNFAKRAADGSRFMFVSHSSIRTPGYASTTQTAQYLIWKLGGRAQGTSAVASDPMGLDRYTTFTRGNFHVRGFAGSGASDHCAHLGLMRDVLAVHLQPFWQKTRSDANHGAAIARRD